MMSNALSLSEELYQVKNVESKNGHLEALINLIRESQIFEAHFPGNPVLPGVCAMQIMKELIQDNLESPINLVRVSNLKFLKVINPDDTPEMMVKIETSLEEGTLGVIGSFEWQGEVYLKYKAQYTVS